MNAKHLIDTIKKHLPRIIYYKQPDVDTKPKQKLYIHYGSQHFIIDDFIPVINDLHPWIKPAFGSGLWASPLDTLNGWYAWCIENDFNTDRLTSSFVFKLKSNSKVLYISNTDDLKFLKENELLDARWKKNDLSITEKYVMDFEKIRDIGYDAIEVEINSSTYYPLYGWDCDSLLVLNPNCVVEV